MVAVVGRWRRSLLLLISGAATCTYIAGSPPLRAVGNQQGPAANQQPPGNWRCCWNIESCVAASAASCPASPEPPLTACATNFAACTGPCSRLENRTMWCQTDPTGCDDSNPPKCVAPPSTFDDPTLRQKFRPPQQTPLQAEAMGDIAATALKQSADAQPWMLEYMQSVRASLAPSLQSLSKEQLLEMFIWEFQRLPIFHNAPLDAWDVDRAGIKDDTPLNITLENGHIQQPCERWVLGGPQDLFSTIMYGNMFSAHFDLKVQHLCDLTHTLREANNCLLFNANNLLHEALGNDQYGGMTYVLDAKKLSREQRMFMEPVDGGLMTQTQWGSWKFWVNLLFGNFGWNTWVLGTLYPPAFLHLVQPHEAENLHLNPAYTNMAEIFNYWWADGAAFPSMTGGNIYLSYFEVMTSKIWLPEDLLTGIAKYSSGDGAPGVWGTELGMNLRQWYADNNRPLLWADRPDGPMLLDPLVVSRLTGFSHQVKLADIERFRVAWGAPSWPTGSFDTLAALTPKYLHFNWPSWKQKAACEEQEKNVNLHVMGTDGNGDCVYWAAPNPPQASQQKWECLNDGQCVPSSSSRALFASESQCKTECGNTWECVKPTVSVSHPTAYCVPVVSGRGQRNASTAARVTRNARLGANDNGGDFPSVDACEAACNSEIDSDRATLCHNWEAIIVSTIWGYLIVQVSGCCAVRKWVAPRQHFKTGLCVWCGLSQCCTKREQDQERRWCTGSCLFATCCPWFQWLRVIAFLFECPRTACSKCCSCFGCLLFTGCFLMNPFGLGCYVATSCLFGNCKSACTRYKIRQRLNIAGHLWEDCVIHCFAGLCAWCQEAQEISAAGHSGILYQNYREPVMPLEPATAAAPPVQARLASVGYQPAFFQQQNTGTIQEDADIAIGNRRTPTRRLLLQEPLLTAGGGGDGVEEARDASKQGQATGLSEPQPEPEPEEEPVPPTNVTRSASPEAGVAPKVVIPWGPGHPNW